MAGGISTKVTIRLWNIISMMLEGYTRDEIIRRTHTNARNFSADINRLKKLGIKLKYSRLKGAYEVYWPFSPVNVKFTPEEFFYVIYSLKNISDDNAELKPIADKLELLLSSETDPVYDCGPAYGIGQNITANIADVLRDLKNAIVKQLKIVFFYNGINGNKIRIVHPYKLIHTPISWYLIGFCEEKKEYRNFKLARISQLKLMSDHYNKRNFILRKQLGDAFWLRYDPARITNPYLIKVLFKGDAAQSIKEYKFHQSQKLEDTPEGTVVSWELSWLGEIATWLMQWLGTFEIIEGDELKRIINKKIEEGIKCLKY